MSKQTKFYTLLTGLLSLGIISSAQNVPTLEMGLFTSPVTGSGFGPRTTDHVITFLNDALNNSTFVPYSPTVTATVSLKNQTYTGLSYGAGQTNPTGSSNAVPSGLIFGAAPALSTGGTVQQATPLNTFDLLGTYGAGSGGPTNNMFTSNPNATGAQLGTGIDATNSAFGTDVNAGVEVFTCAQVLYDQSKPYSTSSRFLYGQLVVTFSRFVTSPVIHLAGLGGSYRYLPATTPQIPDVPANYLSAYFSTELELVGPSPITKMSGNAFFNVVGQKVLNSATTPNGGSTLVPGETPFDNYGAASGSVRIEGPVKVVTFNVYLRGSDNSQFGWSTNGIGTVAGATRAPLAGDIWYVAASVEPTTLITLPATGMQLAGSLSGNDVVLNWKTLSEANSQQFVIERSTDGANYSPIGTKAAAGNSVSEKTYTFTDANMTADIYYYRVKLVDFDNKFSYTNIVPIRKTGVKAIRTYPNPAVSNLNVEFSNAKGTYVISMFNVGGQEVSTQKATISYTVQSVPVNRGVLAPGTYYLRIRNTDSGEVYNDKVVLQ